jgi:hypothetical protein
MNLNEANEAHEGRFLPYSRVRIPSHKGDIINLVSAGITTDEQTQEEFDDLPAVDFHSDSCDSFTCVNIHVFVAREDSRTLFLFWRRWMVNLPNGSDNAFHQFSQLHLVG